MLRTGREGLNMFKSFMRFFFSTKHVARLSRDCRVTFARRSCECREHVAAKFWRIQNAKISRFSYDCRTNPYDSRATVLATIWRENKTKRHSYECRETFSRMKWLETIVRMKMKLKLHSWERRETISRMFRDCHTNPEIYFQN